MRFSDFLLGWSKLHGFVTFVVGIFFGFGLL